MKYNILFKGNRPIAAKKITQEIVGFGSSYYETTQNIIAATDRSYIDKSLFCTCSAKLLNSFLMARSGQFKGIGIDPKGNIKGPAEKLEACWGAVKNEVGALKSNLVNWQLKPRSRTLRLLSKGQMEITTDLVWKACKNLLPICMTKHSYGLVAASKILYAVFPEIVLPIDNAQWKQVFKTVDLGDVLNLMRSEIFEWEAKKKKQLETCEKAGIPTTLPAIYNVMAMVARR